MLPKKKRLTKEAFDRFFSLGRRLHTPLFTLIYTPHECFHGAVVVPKKVERKAVIRNKIRRRVYAALYETHQSFVVSGVYVVIVKPQIKHASYQEIKNMFEKVIGRVVHHPVE